MSFFRRIIGFLIIIVGIVGLVISGGIAYFGSRAVDAFGVGLNATVDLLDETVNTTVASLENVKATLGETSGALTTVSGATRNMAVTIYDTQPLMRQVTGVTTDTVPNSIEAVNDAFPNLASVAKSIDSTLKRLSTLQVNQTLDVGPFSVPLTFDLGIRYAPREPFDSAILSVGESLIPLPDQLRAMEANLETTVTNLGNIADNIDALAGNINGINATVEQYIPLLDQYIRLLGQITTTLAATRNQINANLTIIKWVVIGLASWFALYQIVPIYFGYRMLSDKVVEGSIEEYLEEERKEMREQIKEAEEQAEEAEERAEEAEKRAEKH
ncbi:MAG: hypothetical protein LC131_12235 [Anaerolineae bacterium]|nr:hypothetical protein [Promineifilum sp.]MCZ2114582.1 hypothetical protein [Anaerolineae bacterium]HNS39447.1 hypothetical protein [Promineifilum sp.]